MRSTRSRAGAIVLALVLGGPATAAAICGDGVLEPPELCDDGNLLPGDGCSPLCLPENLPPDCTGAVAVPDDLWPPNHALVPIAVDGLRDPDGDAVRVTVTAVSSDEPADATGDGNTCSDAQGVGTAIAAVRAERSGQGDGRVYRVAFVADDGRGGACSGEVLVCVRHDGRPGGVCGDQGALYDAAGGDPAVCGGCHLDECVPSDDELGACADEVPRPVARRTLRARSLLERAATAPAPRAAKLARRATRLLDRAATRAQTVLDGACADAVAGLLRGAQVCARCAEPSDDG